MVGRMVLEASYWPAEAGQVRDITVCELLRHAAATVPARLALVDCVPEAAARREWTYAEFVAAAEQAALARRPDRDLGTEQCRVGDPAAGHQPGRHGAGGTQPRLPDP
jgi:non-ribosomal peptide synthetase component E (peptide arylation enzyme)